MNFACIGAKEGTDMTDIEREVQKLEEGEAWEETDEVVEIEVKRPLNKVIPVRLSSEKWEELRREAHDVGVGPTTLARMWILEKLRQVMLTKKSA
jgi:hypothetical protein